MEWQEQYRILTPVRESFKGALFLAQEKTNGQTVMLRILYRSRAEAYRVLQQLHSPQLPRILAVFQDGEDAVIVEEHLQGETLAEFLQRGGRFSLPEQISFLCQVCEGLGLIHRYGIIHRDLKPENLFLCGGRVVLIDFDASRQYRQEMTRDTVFIGTTGYAAPEQYGFAQTDARSDLYALGVVLKELTGNHPQHVLAPVIRRCTAFDPANRYASAQEILWDLERMGLLRRAAPQTNPSPGRVEGGQPAGRPVWKKVLRILLAVFFGLEALLLLLPMPHEVTPADYLLSKLVYLEIVFFPAVLCLNLFHLWKWAPLLRSRQRGLQVLGVCLYLLIACIVIILSQAMAGALYSPEARQLIEMASA